LFSIERETTCWQDACRRNSTCNTEAMYCDNHQVLGTISVFLNASCPIQDNTTLFNYGIFLDALKSGVVESRDFPQKFFYCFWWGLRNLRCALVILILCSSHTLQCLHDLLEKKINLMSAISVMLGTCSCVCTPYARHALSVELFLIVLFAGIPWIKVFYLSMCVYIR